MLRKIIVFALIIICFILQCSVFDGLALAGIIPNLMLILTSSFGFMRGEREGLLIGFFCGMLSDIFFGSFFLVKQELQHKKHGILSSVKVLRQYGKHPFVKKSMRVLAKGCYVRKIEPLSWKLIIRATAVFFTLHLYWPLACGIALLRKLQIDERITKARYKGAKPF